MAEKNRVHNVLEDANIKLASVAADIFGVSGQAMLEGLIDGDLAPEHLSGLPRGKLRQKLPELIDALEGRVADHHRFLLRMHLDHLAYLQQAIAELHSRIEEKIQPHRREVELMKTLPGVDAVTAQHTHVEMGGDLRPSPPMPTSELRLSPRGAAQCLPGGASRPPAQHFAASRTHSPK